MQLLQPNFMTDIMINFVAQQKQRTKTHFDRWEENIFTYRSQPIQRLQPKIVTDSTKKFMYIKHSGGNEKLRIFSSYRNDNVYSPIL